MTNEEGKELLDVLMDAGSKVTNARYKTALKKEVATVRFVDGGDVYIRPVSDMSTPTVITPTSVSDLDPGDIAMPNITWQLLSFGDIVEVVYAQSLNDGCIIRKVGVASSDFIAMSNATFMGNVDIVQRRCAAILSNVGWYRVLHYAASGPNDANGGDGIAIDFDIVRSYSNTNNEVHHIRLLGVYASFAWVDESSKSNSMIIDKIRYTLAGSDAYVDIHYAGTLSNYVSVEFDVKSFLSQKKLVFAESLQSVVDAPSGETVVASWEFHENNYCPNIGIRMGSNSIITGNGDLADTGHYYSATPSEISLAASTWKTTASLALTAGKYIISGTVRFAGNSTGRRMALLSTSANSSSDLGIIYVDTVKGFSDGGGFNFAHFCAPLQLGSSNTVYLNAWQNSGGALSTIGRLYAMKIA